MNKEIHDKIVALIPSNTLKNAIKESEFIFPELDLFRIILRCAPSLEERTELLKEAKGGFSPQLCEYTDEYIEYQKGCLELFMKPEANYVYSVVVLPSERYLFKTAKEAIEFTSYYSKTYDASTVAFHIEKTPILCLSEVNEDVLVAGNHNCTAKNGKVVEVSSAYDCDYKFPKKCDGNCFDCERFCHIKYEDEVKIPVFLKKGDLIKYEDNVGRIVYAISLGENENDTITAYCVPLDSAEVVYHAFEDSFYAHRHPELYTVEKAEIEELDEKMREDYLAFRDYLDATKRQ